MTVERLEEAIVNLLDRFKAPGQRERLYQEWLEGHAFLFELLGYEDVLPQPSLVDSKGQEFIPDFMATRDGGIWEVIEIKRPDTAILKDSTRRQQFYREFGRYVQQCRDYSTYFEDEQNRRSFEQQFGKPIQRRVRTRLIAGRSEGLDRRRTHDLISESDLLDFQTYEDLLQQLDRVRKQLAGEENLPGLSFHAWLTMRRPPAGVRHWIADLGQHTDRNRISVYLEADLLRVDVRDADGELHRLQLEVGDALRQASYLGFELGLGPSSAVGRIWLNDKTRTARWSPFPLAEASELPMVIGNSVEADGTSDLDLFEHYGYPQLTMFHERVLLREYMATTPHGSALRFADGRFMHSRGHPRFPTYKAIQFQGIELQIAEPRSRDLTQNDSNRQPVLVMVRRSAVDQDTR